MYLASLVAGSVPMTDNWSAFVERELLVNQIRAAASVIGACLVLIGAILAGVVLSIPGPR
jgi:hypothetical protein